MKYSEILINNDAVNIKRRMSYMPWVVCFVASLFFFYEFIQMNMFNAINMQIMNEFSLTAGMLGKLSASYFYANVLFLIPAGMLLDRLSTKKIIITSLSICVIGTFLFSVATSLSILTLCRFMTGIGSAFCFLSCIRLASRWFPKQRMALVSGLIVTMAMIGGVAAQVPLTLLVTSLGWRTGLQIDATLGFLIITLIYYFVYDFPVDQVGAIQTEKATLTQHGYLNSLRHAFFSKQNWFCGIYTSLLNLPLFLLGGLWGSLYLNSVYHLPRTETTFVTSMIFLGTIIGSPLMGWFSDKLATRKKLMLAGAIISFFLMMTLLLLLQLSFWSLMLLFFLLGFTTSTQVISYPTVTESNDRMITATCVSVVSLCAISGGAIFEPFFGWLMDYHWIGVQISGVRHYALSDFQFAMWLFPIGIIIAFICACFIKETAIKKEVRIEKKKGVLDEESDYITT